MKMKKTMTTSFRLVTVAAVLGSTCALTLAKAEAARPLEIFCEVFATGKALSCQYLDGETKKPMNDQDLLTFVNRATKGAYLTVKSKKGLERTYQLDANGAEFRKFAEISKTASTRELGQAKLDVFSAIEQKAIKISDALDTSAPAADLVRSDPAIANEKFNHEIRALNAEKTRLEQTCNVPTDKNVDKELESLTQEKRSLTHYLSILLKTMKDPGACTESFNLKVDKDGSIGLSQVTQLSNIFQEKCRKEKTFVAPACIPAVVERSTASASLNSNTPFKMLYAKEGKAKETQNSAMRCNFKYEQGPFIIAAESLGDKAICYGLAQCGKIGQSMAKTRMACEGKMVDGHISCMNPDQCLKSNQIMIFNSNIRVE
ncbi:MAG: hypothetical protein H7222_07585 [Methylotenera sp.]|nr:hypothetical protein [Oligoflexia bacterium]